MEVLSTESVDKLRQAVWNNPNLVGIDFNDLRDQLDLVMVKLSSPIEVRGMLFEPTGQSQELNNDLQNCCSVQNVIRNLTPSVATDERLWVTLCFLNFSTYCRKRWPLERAQNPQSHCQLHWFAKSTRNRIRDNAIARLWWVNYICSSLVGIQQTTATEILLKNSDFRSNLIERNSISNSRNVLTAILIISSKAERAGLEFNRKSFRRFMQQVDLLGRSLALHALSVQQLEKMLAPIFEQTHLNR